MNIVLYGLACFGLGFVTAASKDLLQYWLYNRQVKKLGSMDSEEMMEQMMEMNKNIMAGFAPNTPPSEDDKDSKGINSEYRSYFS